MFIWDDTDPGAVGARAIWVDLSVVGPPWPVYIRDRWNETWLDLGETVNLIGGLPLTAKGDLLTHDGTDPSVLVVGANGRVLMADSAVGDGIKWGGIEPVVGAEWGDALASSALTAGAQTPQFRPTPWPHTIIGAYAWASPAGNASFEVWRQNAGLPDSADKISGTDPIVLSSAAYVEKTSFTGWSLTGAVDDIYGFSPSGEATAKLIGVALILRRTG